MVDWDDDSPRLRSNLLKVVRSVRNDAERRKPLAAEGARRWQRDLMKGLAAPDPNLIGKFRGETGLENCNVIVGAVPGVHAPDVLPELAEFDRKLQQALAELDQQMPLRKDLTVDDLAAVLTLCAWVHSEWIRIHPFANGNGRTARLWVNSIAMRYGLPPFLSLRPRPGGDYGRFSAEGMQGNWRPTIALFRQMFIDFVRPS
jgi:hypothetical protein